MKIWKNGRPPSLGWWPASQAQEASVLRWWNGRTWSFGLTKERAEFLPGDRIDDLARNSVAIGQEFIQWTDRPDDWPEHSRT